MGSGMAVVERARLGRRLVDLLGEDAVLHRPEDVIVYEYDYGLDRAVPQAVVFPRNTAEVASVVRLARSLDLPIVARGAGTGISGGAVPVEGGIVIALARMKRILDVDLPNRVAVVEPGVVNLNISKAAEPYGLFFAPDPSSQKASTIGGNVGNNAGGPHCLALGSTTNHILGVELVLPSGDVLDLGGAAPDRSGFDLTGLVVGAEGTVGIVTRVIVKLLAKPEAVRTFLAIFDTVGDASEAVSRIVGRGIIPSALELMDQLALQAIEAAFHAGYPPDAEAVLLVELDGLVETVAEQGAIVERICVEQRARDVRVAETEEARAKLWAARKGAASAMGRIAPNYYLHDTVIARTRLPGVLSKVVEIGKRHNLPIANLFHAGDGNLHPMILFDVREQGVLDRVMEAGREILKVSVDAGGTISGEHGIGVEKNRFMPWIFSEADLDVMARVRAAFDPTGTCNPGKVLPTASACHDAYVRPRAAVAAGHPELWI
jgi:glycolate oxidase